MMNIWSPQKLQEAGNNPSLETTEGARPSQHLDFGLLVSKNEERTNFCCFKLRNLWYFALEYWETHLQ